MSLPRTSCSLLTTFQRAHPAFSSGSLFGTTLRSQGIRSQKRSGLAQLVSTTRNVHSMAQDTAHGSWLGHKGPGGFDLRSKLSHPLQSP